MCWMARAPTVIDRGMTSNASIGVAVVGYGNTPETRITVPRLTSIGPDRRDFSVAAEFMVSRLARPDTPGRHRAEPYHLSIREST